MHIDWSRFQTLPSTYPDPTAPIFLFANQYRGVDKHQTCVFNYCRFGHSCTCRAPWGSRTRARGLTKCQVDISSNIFRPSAWSGSMPGCHTGGPVRQSVAISGSGATSHSYSPNHNSPITLSTCHTDLKQLQELKDVIQNTFDELNKQQVWI